jgi:hypothetical protein
MHVDHALLSELTDGSAIDARMDALEATDVATDTRLDAVEGSLGSLVAPPASFAPVFASESAMVQSAISAANASGGGRVALTCGADYTLEGINVPSNVTFDLNRATITHKASSATFCIRTVDGSADAQIINGFVDGNQPNQVTVLNTVELWGTRPTLRDVTIWDSAYHPVAVRQRTFHATINAVNIYKKNADYSAQNHGINVLGNSLDATEMPEHTLVTNCHVQDTKLSNIAVGAGKWTSIVDNVCERSGAAGDGVASYVYWNSHTLIEGNTFRDNDNHHVHAGGDYVTLVGNHGYNAGTEGYVVQSSPNSEPTPAVGCHIANNTSVTTRTLGGSSGSSTRVERYTNVVIGSGMSLDPNLGGFNVVDCADVAIYPGLIKDAGSHGIRLAGCTTVAITGGVITNNAGNGIYLVNQGRTLGAEKTGLTIDASTDVLTLNAHGYVDTTPIQFSALTGGTGLAVNTTYYVRDSTANTFKLAATSGGVAINVTADATAGTVKSVTVIETSDVEIQGTIIKGNTGWGILAQNSTIRVSVDATVKGNTAGNISLLTNRTTNFVVPGKTDTTTTIASATTLTLPSDIAFFNVTGTTPITSITTSWPQRVIYLKFATGAANMLVDGGNLKLGGSLSPDADDVVTLVGDGTNWYQASPLSAN